MQISEEIIQKIKEQNDIVDIISETVKLKRTGRNFSGLCPFHNEKSPSFSVSQEKQIYKCFGCGEAGNVISFVMKTKNMQFLEALRYLADRANIHLDFGNKENNKTAQKKDLLYKINVEAARFFFSNLMNNQKSKEYFLNRGIRIETIKRFGLGYANDSWNNLIYHLRKRGFSEELMAEAGLISINKEKGTKYDRFRNRVMFPVFDYRGKVIGFGGRVLDDSKPKYLNSPETLVFQKGTNLYGLNFALKSNMQERYFIIVEGYMDLIALHQSGITNVVASLGTALTINQARLLKRYADKVVISYDADMAGQMATMRGLEILRNAGFDVRVLSIPKGKDPDEFIKSNGKEAFLKLVNTAEPLIDYRLRKAEEGINFRNTEAIIKYSQNVMEIIADLNPLEKDVYIKKASENTGIKEQALYDILGKKLNGAMDNNKNRFISENEKKIHAEAGYIKAERSLLKFMITEAEYLFYIMERISKKDFILEEHKQIFTVIIEGKGENINNIISYLESKLNSAETIAELVKIKECKIFLDGDVNKQIDDFIHEIKTQNLKIEIENLKRQQKVLEGKGEVEESIKLAIKLSQLMQQLNNGKRG